MKIDKHNFNTTKWFKYVNGRAICTYWRDRWLKRCDAAEAAEGK